MTRWCSIQMVSFTYAILNVNMAWTSQSTHDIRNLAAWYVFRTEAKRMHLTLSAPSAKIVLNIMMVA